MRIAEPRLVAPYARPATIAACLYNLGLVLEASGRRGEARAAWQRAAAAHRSDAVERALERVAGADVPEDRHQALLDRLARDAHVRACGRDDSCSRRPREVRVEVQRPAGVATDADARLLFTTSSADGDEYTSTRLFLAVRAAERFVYAEVAHVENGASSEYADILVDHFRTLEGEPARARGAPGHATAQRASRRRAARRARRVDALRSDHREQGDHLEVRAVRDCSTRLVVSTTSTDSGC
ncbi:Hypothetical protein I5071_570 (plasmid) [Sandaracinus amylolyticus]|uniref:hypothetical protein n=1 Tax=Sandaracinus sp. TaxID=2024858 RepID=UPI0019D43DB6|nr:hypothetical protein [Sandaracinus sp.]UJR87265.1 Hypothetical protein I5071_570 [Sandaracinus amylolyticus]